jgi:deazaflavin-dependent oxidoreductase (nitroreductase family)
MASPNPKDMAARMVNELHKGVLRLSGGRLGGDVMGMPVVELTTIGRKSGHRRTTMLTSPVQLGDSIVLVASYGGDDRDPSWYRNLQANPDVEITMRGTSRTMTARTATPEERTELWPRVTNAYSGYAQYQTRTDREIPLVILDPR